MSLEFNFIPRSVLVTGGAGFIGCHYVQSALDHDPLVKVVTLDALTYAGSLDNLTDVPDDGRHIFVQGNICDTKLVDSILHEHEIDTIINFAAESHVDNSIVSSEVFVETNIVGTYRLLESARQYWQEEKQWDIDECCFHQVSTDEVFGALQSGDPAFSETTPYAPNSPYSASKAASDHLIRAWFHTYGLPVTTSNCSNNYGPKQHREKFIPTVIRSCVENTTIPVYGDGMNIRDWLYVDDHCLAIDTIVRSGRRGETFNIGGSNERANIEICHMICDTMETVRSKERHSGKLDSYRQLITFVTDRPGHDWRYAIDSTKLHSELCWEPKETFESGIRKTIEWYLSSHDH